MAKRKSSSGRVKAKLKKQLRSAVTSASKKNRVLSLALITVVVIASIGFILYDFYHAPAPFVADGNARVHFIDVGQGDCSLLIADDGSTMLIDCGEAEYSADVLNYLDTLGIARLDYVLATHPHSDHMGGMSKIISSDIEIGTFIMPKIADEYIPTTRAYENMLLALSDKNCKVKTAKTETIGFGAGRLEFITTDYAGNNMNNYSTVVRFVFGESEFLFSGDAEAAIEKKIVAAGYSLSSDVYKAAHHGSSTSSSAMWVNAIDPDYCVIECGAGNSYGHPHSETVALLREYTDIILRTDLSGNVVFTTDGNNIEYTTSK